MVPQPIKTRLGMYHIDKLDSSQHTYNLPPRRLNRETIKNSHDVAGLLLVDFGPLLESLMLAFVRSIYATCKPRE